MSALHIAALAGGVGGFAPHALRSERARRRQPRGQLLPLGLEALHLPPGLVPLAVRELQRLGETEDAGKLPRVQRAHRHVAHHHRLPPHHVAAEHLRAPHQSLAHHHPVGTPLRPNRQLPHRPILPRPPAQRRDEARPLRSARPVANQPGQEGSGPPGGGQAGHVQRLGASPDHRARSLRLDKTHAAALFSPHRPPPVQRSWGRG